MTSTPSVPTLAVDRRSQWSFVGLVGRAALSVIVILALARALGTEGYGVFAGIIAFVTLVAPISTMGIGETLVQRVANNRTAINSAWGSMLLAFSTVGVALYALTMVAAVFVLPGRDLVAIAVLGAMEFISAGVLIGHSRACAALDRYPAMAVHQIGEGAARAAAAVAFWASGSDDLRLLSVFMLVAVVVSALASIGWLVASIGRPRFAGVDIVAESRAGSAFAVNQVSAAVQANVDKTMLVSFGFDEEAGIYAAGYRIVAYAMMPIGAVLAGSYPEFFRRGSVGLASALQYSRQLRPRMLALGVLSGVGAVLVSPLAAWALADQFGGVVPVVVTLSAIPLIKGIQLLLADVLTGSGEQPFRAKAVVGTAALNVALNLVLIPPFTWKGAVAATYLSELVLLVLIAVRIRTLYRRRRTGEVIRG